MAADLHSWCYADNQSGVKWSLKSSQNVWDLNHVDYVVRLELRDAALEKRVAFTEGLSPPLRGLK